MLHCQKYIKAPDKSFFTYRLRVFLHWIVKAAQSNSPSFSHYFIGAQVNSSSAGLKEDCAELQHHYTYYCAQFLSASKQTVDLSNFIIDNDWC